MVSVMIGNRRRLNNTINDLLQIFTYVIISYGSGIGIIKYIRSFRSFVRSVSSSSFFLYYYYFGSVRFVPLRRRVSVRDAGCGIDEWSVRTRAGGRVLCCVGWCVVWRDLFAWFISSATDMSGNFDTPEPDIYLPIYLYTWRCANYLAVRVTTPQNVRV